MIEDRYLGDGVYASFDGFHIWVDTRMEMPINKIALDPHVVVQLVSYIEELRAKIKEEFDAKDGVGHTGDVQRDDDTNEDGRGAGKKS